ncbi:MAG TPA: hypothetical protein PLQ89_12850 [Phycisphaerae bacterium]|nr:hypothetical protein [Phycisphaerae bacterium]
MAVSRTPIEHQQADSPGFELQQLDQQHVVYRGHLPDHLIPDQAQFEKLWNLHPRRIP